MKKLIRRLSRVADSSQYCLLGTTSSRPSHRSSDSVRTPKLSRSGGVPQGHLPVYVGDEMERFVVSAQLLNHPVFIKLLNKSAQEYGYDQKGVLHIPCHVLLFERVLECLRSGQECVDVEDLIGSFSDEYH